VFCRYRFQLTFHGPLFFAYTSAYTVTHATSKKDAVQLLYLVLHIEDDNEDGVVDVMNSNYDTIII